MKANYRTDFEISFQERKSFNDKASFQLLAISKAAKKFCVALGFQRRGFAIDCDNFGHAVALILSANLKISML